MLRRRYVWIALLSCTVFSGCGESASSRLGRSASATSEAPKESSPVPTASLSVLGLERESESLALDSATDQGQGPGMSGDKYSLIVENGFVPVQHNPLSTFSIDVDTASYSKTRMYLLQRNALPPPDAVRIEELLNYFDYDYSPPAGEHPFSVQIEVADAPWRPSHRLARIGLKGRELDVQRPASNLVFLIDVSGSMDYPNRLPLVKQGLRLLTEQLTEQDRVAIVVYAGAAGLVLPATAGDDHQRIASALEQLHAGGSTNGGQGIQLAYEIARQNFLPEGVNRIVLCTDGDFNVGTTSTGELVRLAEQQAQTGVFLTVLGFGMGNHNDSMLEELSNRANGNYAYIDTVHEARKVLCEQINSTLVTIAKDVKIQVEFNPQHVAAYRLIGYENRRLEAHEFNDDRKDAGEIGAGHAVTALYELIPPEAATTENLAGIDPLKYQKPQPSGDGGEELMTVKLRYKHPQADSSQLLSVPVANRPNRFHETSPDFQFASAVAAFGMLLRQSAHRGEASYGAVLEIAQSALDNDRHGYRREFLQLVIAAARLSGEQVVEPIPDVQETRIIPLSPRFSLATRSRHPEPRSVGLRLPLVAIGLFILTPLIGVLSAVTILLCCAPFLAPTTGDSPDHLSPKAIIPPSGKLPPIRKLDWKQAT